MGFIDSTLAGASSLSATDSSSALRTDLALLHRHGLPAGGDLLVDAGQEVLGDAQGVLQERVVGVGGGGVLQEVLG